MKFALESQKLFADAEWLSSEVDDILQEQNLDLVATHLKTFTFYSCIRISDAITTFAEIDIK